MPSSNEIQVLDKGYVRLVDFMGGDLSIVRAARVSYNADWRTGEDAGKDAKLINYMMEHDHTTPFEAVTASFEVKAPIFVFRQWHRHRTQSYNEISARYTELIDEFYVPNSQDIGKQSKLNKQVRDISYLNEEELDEREAEIMIYVSDCQHAFRQYKRRLELGWPRELARMGLPFSTYSRMHATANLLNWFRFLSKRLPLDAQPEIRVYANAILTLIRTFVPLATEAFQRKYKL